MTTYQVTLLPIDETFSTSESETILETGLQHEYPLPFGCKEGNCGHCSAKLESGNIEYKNGIPEALNQSEIDKGKILLCQANATSDVIITARLPDKNSAIPIKTLPCRLLEKELLNTDVILLRFQLPKKERFEFLPGQYVELLLPGNKRRAFSLANLPNGENIVEFHIRNYDGGLFSEMAFNDLKENSLLRLHGPLGQFTLDTKSDRPNIMVAGGTGFSPIKSIIEFSIRKNIQRPIHLYWGSRDKAGLYLHELAEQWAEEHEHINYHPVLSEDTNDWNGKTGWVHEAVIKDFDDLGNYDVYTCGPPPMIKAVKDSFTENGVDSDRIFSDSFEFASE